MERPGCPVEAMAIVLCAVSGIQNRHRLCKLLGKKASWPDNSVTVRDGGWIIARNGVRDDVMAGWNAVASQT